jgi:hypothetical protein
MQRNSNCVLKTGWILFLILFLTAAGAFADLKVVNDPAQTAVGARSLGMGGSVLNFSDVSSLFGNPASLINIEEPQYTLMSGKFLNEVDYLSLGMVIPSRIGIIGIGYSSSNLSLAGPMPTTEVVDGDIRIVPSTTEVRSDSYGSSTLQISLSKPAKDFVKIGLFEKLRLGGTLKIFSQNISATGASGTASGYELDLGMQCPINSWMKFSLLGKNLLPASSGGKLVWEPSGREDPFAYYIRSGLLFEWERFLRRENQSFSLAVEHDHHPRGEAPDLLHYGLEWGLGDVLDIRLGRDQGYVGRGGVSVFDVADNLTYGVGVTYRGWRFDYAFHEYYGISENNTHYFSMTYGLPYREVKIVPKKMAIYPEDKFITNLPSIEVSGKVIDKKIAGVFVNDKPVDMVENAFSTMVHLAPGKNRILLVGADKEVRFVTQEARRVLRLTGFVDVLEKHWAKDSIEILATLRIIKGYPGDVFEPENGITRAEFATLLARLVGQDKYQSKERLPFKDFSPRHWAYGAVAYAMDSGLVKGYPDGTFRPKSKITRAEGVAVIARFAGLDLEAPVDEVPYQDVPGRHWAVKEINAAKTAGLLKHIQTNFHPNEDLTRAETAVILARVKYIKDKVDDLLNFEKGYE